MQIIRTDETSTLTIPSRALTGVTVDLLVYREGLRSNETANVAATYSNGLLTFSYDFQGVEGSYYFVVVSEGTTELLKFKAFCTNQTDLQNYTMNEGGYTTPPAPDNSYKTI